MSQPLSTLSESTGPMGVDTALQREAARLLNRAKMLREIQDAQPTDPPPNLTDEELARRLAYDMVTALTRSSVVIDSALPILIEHTEELRRQNELVANDQRIRIRELARDEQQQSVEREKKAWLWGAVSRCFEGVAGWVGSVFADQRIVWTLSGGIATILAALLTILVGYITTHWGTAEQRENPPAIEVSAPKAAPVKEVTGG